MLGSAMFEVGVDTCLVNIGDGEKILEIFHLKF